MLFPYLKKQDLLLKAACTELDTGLPNTYGFQMAVDKIIKSNDIKQYAAFYFDIVRMGQINERFGKEQGDEIIKKYAEEIQTRLDKDEVLGRMSSDFFMALVKKNRTHNFLTLLQNVPVEIDNGEQQTIVYISAIAGVYEIDSDNITSREILGKTAMALTYAKVIAHKPYVFLDTSLESKIHRTHQLEEDIRTGLRQNEFIPFYQPKIDTRTNKLIGAEALARWRHKDTFITPAEFIPVMESSGQVCGLDFYMLNCVCRDIFDWIVRGYKPVPVSVNFSRRNLSEPELATKINETISRYNIPKELIQVEITETVDEQSLSRLAELVDRLRRFGISTAIDDFGSGSSSIKLLKYAKFDALKIDKSFVDYSNDIEKQLLKDIINMAENVGLDVIAEGVEEESQIEELKSMGCYQVQGYVFDFPQKKENFETWLDLA